MEKSDKFDQSIIRVYAEEESESDWLLLSSSVQGLRELEGLTELPESRSRDVF